MAAFRAEHRIVSSLEYSRNGSSFRSSVPQKQLARCDMITFLGIVQKFKIDFLPITWQPALDPLGRGGTAEILEGAVTTQFSFAFKRLTGCVYFDFDNFESLFLRYLVDEVSILGHPRLRKHRNIIGLEGICWEIVAEKGMRISRELPVCFNAEGQGIRPVLVFPKSRYGSLHDFMMQDQGKELNFHSRIDICFDVARAILEMHSHNIIHGDIKPQNILIFDNASKKGYTAKVADFGYSTLWATANDFIQMPRSQPWTAPEWHHRGFTPAQAMLFDTYSFGMLVLWIISFGVRNDYDRYFKIDSHASSNPAELIHEIVRYISQVQKLDFGPFFDVTITPNPADRSSDFVHLRTLLYRYSIMDIQEVSFFHDSRQAEIEPGLGVDDTIANFQVIPSMYQLYHADYRVRVYIARLFLRKLNYMERNQSPDINLQNTLLQCAVCYEVGFGITRDLKKSKQLLDRCGDYYKTKFYRELELAKRNRIDWVGIKFSEPTYYQKMTRVRTGEITPWHNLYDSYVAQEDLEDVEREYRQEIADTEIWLGSDHGFVLGLKQELVHLLNQCRRHEEATKILAELKRTIVYSPRFRWSRVLAAKSTFDLVNSIFWPQRRTEDTMLFWSQAASQESTKYDFFDHLYTVASLSGEQTLSKDAEELSKLNIHEAANSGKVQDILKRVNNTLAKIRRSDQKTVKVSRPTLLVWTLAMQNQWNKTEALQTEIIKQNIKTLGREDANTLISMSELAFILLERGQLQKSKILYLQVVELSDKILGSENPRTLGFLRGLATVCQQQYQQRISLRNYMGKREPSEEVEKLHKRLVELSEKLLGTDHPSTLTLIGWWAWVLYHQKRFKEAEKLEVQNIEKLRRVLGENHPDTLDSIINVAFSVRKQGRWREAQEILSRGIETKPFLSRVSQQIQLFLLLLV